MEADRLVTLLSQFLELRSDSDGPRFREHPTQYVIGSLQEHAGGDL